LNVNKLEAIQIVMPLLTAGLIEEGADGRIKLLFELEVS